jgi:S-adenosyl methyltransferase
MTTALLSHHYDPSLNHAAPMSRQNGQPRRSEAEPRWAAAVECLLAVAIMLIAILHYILGLAEARSIVARLLAAVPPGSFLAVSHAGSDLFPDEIAAFEKNLNEHLPGDRHVARPREEVAQFFEGTTLLTPGVVPVSQWWPATADEAAVPTTLWGGVGRK